MREQGLTIDTTGFEQAMQQQKSRARSASQFHAKQLALPVTTNTKFTGYEQTSDVATVVEIFKDGQPVTKLLTNEIGCVVLDHTPFYAESGGQVI